MYKSGVVFWSLLLALGLALGAIVMLGLPTNNTVHAAGAMATTVPQKPGGGKNAPNVPASLADGGAAEAPVAPDRTGGPDAFGYSYDDSNEPGGLTYQYISAANLVNGLHGSDDGTYTDTVPFPLTIYGHQSYTVTISTNGHVHFNSDYCYTAGFADTCNWSDMSLPSSLAPNGIVAPFWDDIDLHDASGVATGDVYTSVTGIAGSRIYTVEWRNAPLYRAYDNRLNFEVLFQENSSNIIFQYGNMSGPLSNGSVATIGIQNLDRSVGLTYTSHDPSISQGLAIRFYLPQTTAILPGSQTKGTAPGVDTLFSNTLRNTTGSTNSFSPTLSNSNSAFTASLQSGSLDNIPAGATVPLTVTVDVPQGASLGTTNVTTLNLRAASNFAACPNNDCSITVYLTTTINTLGASFDSINNSKVGSAGEVITYTTNLFNRSGQTNSFTLDATGNSWPVTIIPATTNAINANSSVPVSIYVTIPDNVDLGARDTVTITAHGQLPNVDQFSGQLALTTVAGNWARRGYMNYPRSRFGLADYPPTGKVYALGGIGINNQLDLPVEEFDARSGTWAPRNKLLTPVSNVGAATVGALIYAPGGFNGTAAITTLQTYNPTSNTAAIVTSDPLPVGLVGAGVAAMNNKLYVVGGSTMAATSHALYVYDPAQSAGQRWQRKADMPTGRVWLAVAALDNKLYALGGTPDVLNLTDLDTVEVYDAASNTWATGVSLPRPLGGAAATGVPEGVACGGYIYVAGGGWLNPTSFAERYSPATGWTELANMHSGRRNLGFAFNTNRGQLIAAGGYDNSSNSGYTEALGCGGASSTEPTVTPGGQPTPTQLPNCNFSDVPTSFYGYEPITWLACRGMVSGYSDNTFRPFNNMTRGQITKVVALSRGWALANPTTPTFDDVPTTNPFYRYIETAVAHGVIQGYADHTFRWSAEVTRGQIAKIVVLAAGIPINTSGGQRFTDVLATNPFYDFIETAYNDGLISGYDDHTFRWGSVATRAQVAKVVYLAAQ